MKISAKMSKTSLTKKQFNTRWEDANRRFTSDMRSAQCVGYALRERQCTAKVAKAEQHTARFLRIANANRLVAMRSRTIRISLALYLSTTLRFTRMRTPNIHRVAKYWGHCSSETQECGFWRNYEGKRSKVKVPSIVGNPTSWMTQGRCYELRFLVISGSRSWADWSRSLVALTSALRTAFSRAKLVAVAGFSDDTRSFNLHTRSSSCFAVASCTSAALRNRNSPRTYSSTDESYT